MLVFVDGGEDVVAEHLLGLSVLLQLEDELVDLLGASSHMALRRISLHSQSVQFFLHLGNLSILVLNLLFFDVEQTLHVRVLFFKACYSVVFATIILEQLTKLLIRIDRILLRLSLHQSGFLVRKSRPLLDQLLPRIERVNMTILGLQQPLVEVDKRFVLHLAIAAITSAVERLVLL